LDDSAGVRIRTMTAERPEELKACRPAVCLVLTEVEELAAYEQRLPNAFPMESEVRFRFGSDPTCAADQAVDVDVVICSPPLFTRELLLAAKQLRWIHSNAHGVEQIMIPDVVRSAVDVTSSKGVFTQPVSEHALAMILALARTLVPRRGAPIELEGKTLGLVGLGTIGSAIACKARCLGMKVVAVRRHPNRANPLVDEVWGPSDLPRLLRMVDVVVLTAARTPETEGLIGGPELAQMKASSFLINISRGALVDEQALATALHEGTIAGAALDVTSSDPSLAESPLHGAPHLLLTPYIAYSSKEAIDRGVSLAVDNLVRFLSGQPLRNLVDKEQGY